jgi:ribonucleoside-diphosphate reductase alpha chain
MKRSDFDIPWRVNEWGEFPSHFSDTACRIVSQQYFRNGEQSFWEVVERVVEAIGKQWGTGGYFTGVDTVEINKRKLAEGLLEQRFSFNSPVWYNLGVNDDPQCSACFIQPVEDNMESIMQLATNEAMLFKHGSGTGTNLSSLRSSKETLSKSDGYASGPVSFMRMYDSVAGAIKSGGRTRRAAKMQLLDADHPDISEFIRAKAEAGRVAKKLIDSGMSAEGAYSIVPFQNANLSVRVKDDFFIKDTTVIKAKDPAWECGDPGMQFVDTINRDNMTPDVGPINASNPCSEFVFIDSSACNLASINIMQYSHPLDSVFIDDVRVLIFAMDAIVSLSGYPTEKIRENSLKYRPLGLGLTNIGAHLMEKGMQYDSESAGAPCQLRQLNLVYATPSLRSWPPPELSAL